MTLRTLAAGAEARQAAEWERTAWLLAKIHNTNCARKADAISPNDVNPMYRGERRKGGQKVDADFNAAMYEALEAAERKRGQAK